MVARVTSNHKVAGSTPAFGFFFHLTQRSGCTYFFGNFRIWSCGAVVRAGGIERSGVRNDVKALLFSFLFSFFLLVTLSLSLRFSSNLKPKLLREPP